MPIAFTSTLTEDSHSGHSTKPFNTGTQTRIYQRTGGQDFDINDFLYNEGGIAVGDNPFIVAPGEARAGYVVDVAITQLSKNSVREVIRYDDQSQYHPNFNSGNTHSLDSTSPGYVNTDLRATEASATWWRYAAESVWADSGANPWDTADVPDSFQCLLEQATGYVCDLGGVPMTAPVAQEELIITTTWESNSAATAYRARWAATRHARNDDVWLGYPKGTLLFTGGSTRASGRDEMPVSDLRLVYDPYGHCRQRAVSDANGAFTEEYLTTVSAPVPGGGPCDDDDAPDHLHAKYVYWVSLFQSLQDFDLLLTSSQKDLVETLIT